MTFSDVSLPVPFLASPFESREVLTFTESQIPSPKVGPLCARVRRGEKEDIFATMRMGSHLLKIGGYVLEVKPAHVCNPDAFKSKPSLWSLSAISPSAYEHRLFRFCVVSDVLKFPHAQLINFGISHAPGNIILKCPCGISRMNFPKSRIGLRLHYFQ